MPSRAAGGGVLPGDRRPAAVRLVSVDLDAKADITNLAEVFDFARDYCGLLKAALIAAGLVPARDGRLGRAWPTCWRGWWGRAVASSW